MNSRWIAAAMLVLCLFAGCRRQEPEACGEDRFAVGVVLMAPKTLDLDYEKLIDRTVGKVSRKAFRKYQNNFDAYLRSRRSDARGKVFEAVVALEANRRFEDIDRPERILTTAAEGDPAHPADNLLWVNGRIKQRYQLKSTRNEKSIIKFLSQPEYVKKYANEIIVTHPDTFNGIERELSKRKRLDPSLPPEWQQVDQAFRQGRVTDEVFPGLKVPTYYEATKKAEEVIRRQFERARQEYSM